MPGTRPKRQNGAFRESFRTQLWPLPVAGIIVAVLLGIGAPALDGAVDGSLPESVGTLLFGGGPDAARTVLSAISGSLITVTSLTFSLTVVTLQLASSQFSPRLLRTFTRDRFVHVTLAVFLATFVYSVVVLRTVRDKGDDRGMFVPEISVTLSVLATLASVVCLVLFLAHLSSQIRVETILQRVRNEATDTLQRTLDARADGPHPVDVIPASPERAVPLPSPGTGFLASVDPNELLAAATDADAVVIIEGFPGGSMIEGVPLGRYWMIDPVALLDRSSRDELEDRLGASLQIGPERTAAQDVAFGLRQLTDVADKALSPGINDPTTAVHALGHVSAVLCTALQYELGPLILRDDHGAVRVVVHRPTFADLLDGAVAQPRRYGSDSQNVLDRIARLLREVAWHANDQYDADAIREQVARLDATIDDADLQDVERSALKRSLRPIEDALAKRW